MPLNTPRGDQLLRVQQKEVLKGWREYIAPAGHERQGQKYWYNHLTKQSSWLPPTFWPGNSVAARCSPSELPRVRLLLVLAFCWSMVYRIEGREGREGIEGKARPQEAL